jgi:hypothetical protein
MKSMVDISINGNASNNVEMLITLVHMEKKKERKENGELNEGN